MGNYLLDILNGVSWLNVKSNGLAGKGFDKNLHIYLSNK